MDWNWFAVFRTLFSKLSSYVLANINLPILYIVGLNDRISKNDFPIVTVTCYYIDDTDKRRKIKTIFLKKYYILKCINERPVAEQDERIPCTLILANPVFREMYSNNGFNKILYNVTALDAIKDFENFLIKSYGDTFDFIKIGNNLQINTHVYEQMLFKNLTDLIVPLHIIQIYKPFYSFNTYFFDDFNLHIEKEIAAYHLNFYNCHNTFNRYDVSQMPDITTQFKVYKEYTIEDQFENINKDLDKASITIIDRYMNSKNIKKQRYELLNLIPGNKVTEELYEGRKFKSQNSEPLIQTKSTDQSIQYANIYVPDIIEIGETRFNINKKLFILFFKSVRLIQINYDLPDWLTFDRIYNIDLQNKSTYCFIPMSAVNVFYRTSRKEHYVTHSTKAMFLQIDTEAL
jgi:hypothetical protein